MSARGFLSLLVAPVLWANSAPQPLSVLPNGGQGTLSTFAVNFQDTDGADDIVRVQVSIENTLTPNDTCMFYYSLASNEILIRDGSPPLGWSAPQHLGGTGLLSNGR